VSAYIPTLPVDTPGVKYTDFTVRSVHRGGDASERPHSLILPPPLPLLEWMVHE
jgi:hypothetical protein